MLDHASIRPRTRFLDVRDLPVDSSLFTAAMASPRGVFGGNLRSKDVQQRRAAIDLLAVGGSTRDPFRLGTLFLAKAVKGKSLSMSILDRRSVRIGGSIRTSATGGNPSPVGESLQITATKSCGGGKRYELCR